MSLYRITSRRLAAWGTLVLGACAQVDLTESESGLGIVNTTRPASVVISQAVSGQSGPVSRGDSIVLVRALARQMAIGLGSADNRTAFLAALGRSRMREGKLHMQRFMSHAGALLAEAIAARTDWGVEGFIRVMASLASLEFYLPVPAHRTAWRGGSEILVVGLLEHDDELRRAGNRIPAFDTRGQEVELSTESPPTVPVLVLTGIEQQFGEDGEGPPPRPQPTEECPPTADECDGGGYSAPPAPYSYLSLVASTIHNVSQYEGWLMGSPEITVAMLGMDVYGKYAITIGCVNDEVYPVFDQDGDIWVGQANLTTRVTYENHVTAGSKPTVHVWEDDSGSKCDFHPESANEANAQRGALAGQGLIQWALSQTPVHLPWLAVGVGIGIASWVFLSSADDDVGMAMLTGFQDPTRSPREIRRGSFLAGEIKLEYRPMP